MKTFKQHLAEARGLSIATRQGVKDVHSLIRQYRKNEDENFHDKNAVLMAKHFGTPEEHEKAKAIAARKQPDTDGHMSKMHHYFVQHLYPHEKK